MSILPDTIISYCDISACAKGFDRTGGGRLPESAKNRGSTNFYLICFRPKKFYHRGLDIVTILSQLKEELANLNAAIASLEKLRRSRQRPEQPPVRLATVKKTKASGLRGDAPESARRPARERRNHE